MGRKKRMLLGHVFWGAVLRFLIWLFLKVEVRGGEQVPIKGAGIVYYNHIHWLDPVAICGRLDRYSVPLAKVEISRWPIAGTLLRWYGAVFITRGAVDREALKATWQVLADGDISVISPEGTRSRDGRLQQAKEGLAFIAREAPDAWLIPCAVVDTPKFHWKMPLINRPIAVLTYGQPFRFRWPRNPDGSVGRVGREVLREMTDEAMLALAALLPAEMQGDYAERTSNARWLVYLE